MVGPVVAGFLLVVIDPVGAFLFDALTFLVAIVFVWRMAPSPPAHDAPDVNWSAVVDGFRFLKGKRTIQSVFAIDLNAMIFGFPEALFPAIAVRARGGTGAGVLGLLYAAPAAGAFLATAFSGRAKHVRRQGLAIMWAVVVWGVAIVVFGLSTWLWLSLLMLAIAGMGDMVSGIFRTTILQTAVTDSMRGRLDGIGMAVWAYRTLARRGRVGRGGVDQRQRPLLGGAGRGAVRGRRRCHPMAVPVVRALRRTTSPRLSRCGTLPSSVTEGASLLAISPGAYNLVKFIHVMAAVAWVGGGIMLQVLGWRIQRANDPRRMGEFAKDIAFVGLRYIMPMSILLILAAIGLIWWGPYGLSDTWVRLAVIGYAITLGHRCGVHRADLGEDRQAPGDHARRRPGGGRPAQPVDPRGPAGHRGADAPGGRHGVQTRQLAVDRARPA